MNRNQTHLAIFVKSIYSHLSDHYRWTATRQAGRLPSPRTGKVARRCHVIYFFAELTTILDHHHTHTIGETAYLVRATATWEPDLWVEVITYYTRINVAIAINLSGADKPDVYVTGLQDRTKDFGQTTEHCAIWY